MVLVTLSLVVSTWNTFLFDICTRRKFVRSLNTIIVSGFLAQFVQGKSIDTCIKCGIWAATEIVQMSGCTYEGKPSFQS